MSDMEWKQGSDILRFSGKIFHVSCKVRNELNGLRGRDNIFYTMSRDGSKGVPSQPRIFPKGNWKVTGFRTVSILEDPKKYKVPYFISTDAHQTLSNWEVKNGFYIKNTGMKVEDFGYGLHYSESEYTQGCIKFLSLDELLIFIKEFKSNISQIDKPSQKWLSMEVI